MDVRRLGGRWFALFLAIFVLTAGVRLAPAATPEQVDAAIDKGVKFLYSKLNKDGNWEQASRPELSTPKDNKQIDLKGRQWGGYTAISVYALLAAGENPQDAHLKPAIEFLEKANIQSTYGLGISAQAWNLIPASPAVKSVAAHDVRMLDQGLIRKGENTGFYSYWTGDRLGSDQPRWGDASNLAPQPRWWHDLSNSQYAILGMWALEQSGAEVPSDFWKFVDSAWKKRQEPDGSWRYNKDKEPSPAMTAAGIATLYITQDYTAFDTWSNCKGGSPTPEIDKGMAWMDQHIKQVMDSGDFYTFYGIERIGVASGRKYFGTIDWFQQGSETLVKRQEKDGGWNGEWGQIPSTCFSLLFLSRGSAPVMMNKLQYDTPHAQAGIINVWNERPRDLANLSRWTGKQLEHDLNWQIVNMEVSPDDLHDAPILYLSGSQELAYSPTKLAKFRDFVEGGGMILGNADCARPEFVKSFIRFGRDLFPKYEFRQLPPNHPIYTHEQYPATRWRVRPNVLGLTNGVRELMVLVPDADPSRAWQTHTVTSKEELFELGANIFLYSIDKKNLLTKGRRYTIARDPNIVATKKVKLARLLAGPNPDPEPGGWRRLAALMHNQNKIDLEIFDAKPGEGSLLAARVAHLTGTTAFKLTDPARLELKTFVASGGTLIIDAAGGNAAFAASAEEEMRAIFGPAAAEIETPLPKNCLIYQMPGEKKLDAAGFRAFAKESLPHGTRRPMIKGIKFGNKIRVFYSHLDLSGGLVGEYVDGIYGYDPQTATQLMSNMILYAVGK